MFMEGAYTSLCQSRLVSLVIRLTVWLLEFVEFINPFPSSWTLWIDKFLELCLSTWRSCRNLCYIAIFSPLIDTDLMQDGIETHLFITNACCFQLPSTVLFVWKHSRVC